MFYKILFTVFLLWVDSSGVLGQFFNGSIPVVPPVRPEYIRPCNRTDPKVDKCFAKSITHLKKYLATGIPELGVPSIEPLVVNKLFVENGNGPIRVKAAFSNLTIHGASNFTIESVKSDLKTLRIEVSLRLPTVQATGRYEVTGNVLLLPVRSKGEFWTAFDDIWGVGKVQGREVRRGNEVYMLIDKMSIDFKLKNPRFRVKSRARSSNVLDDAINSFLNQNGAELIEEVKGTAAASVARHFKGILNAAFSRIPMSSYLLN